MKKLALCVLLMYAPLLPASKPDTPDYPIAVHVQCSYVRSGGQRIGVSLDGKPVELTGLRPAIVPLPLGEYKARPVMVGPRADALPAYELLIPNGKALKFYVTGLASTVCPIPS